MKPLRRRVEVIALTDDHRILAFTYPHGGLGLFGGGVELWEVEEEAAAREFSEESGYEVTITGAVAQVLPAAHVIWCGPFSDPKTAKRSEEYDGVTTTFYIGRLGVKTRDPEPAYTPQLFDLQTASKLADCVDVEPTLKDVNAYRQMVIDHVADNLAAYA